MKCLSLYRDHIYTVDIDTANTDEIFFSKVSLPHVSVLPLNYLAGNEPERLCDLTKHIILSGVSVMRHPARITEECGEPEICVCL